jgi:hypothetical protein
MAGAILRDRCLGSRDICANVRQPGTSDQLAGAGAGESLDYSGAL